MGQWEPKYGMKYRPQVVDSLLQALSQKEGANPQESQALADVQLNKKGGSLMADRFWIIVLVVMAILLAALIHGGIYTAIPPPSTSDFVYRLNRFTGDILACAPRVCRSLHTATWGWEDLLVPAVVLGIFLGAAMLLVVRDRRMKGKQSQPAQPISP